MAGREIQHKASAITAATASGYITVASVTGYYKNAVVYLNAAGQPTVRCVITAIDTTANTLGILIRDIEAGSVPSYGRSNISAYNGGSVTQNAQFVYDYSDGSI
jgi:hypothetical protein